ncbi:hypothetical protein D3C83_331580 [compost metagenome]
MGRLGDHLLEIADDEGVLGDDRDRMAEIGEHGEAAARDPELPLDRLVAVGHPAAGE